MGDITDDKVDVHLRILAKSKPLEEYCVYCGECCKPSVDVKKSDSNVKLRVKELNCKFLKDNKCSVYEDRFKKASWCVDLKTMIRDGLAPKDCPYVCTLSGYEPTITLEGAEYGAMIPLLKLAISKGPKKPYIEEDLRKFTND